MYREKIYTFPGSIEHEFCYAGNYGAKGEKRQKKKQATPEQIRKQNQRNRENKIRRLIKANFKENDIYATLKYPRGTKATPEKLGRDFKRFIDRTRRQYRKAGHELKYIYRMEIGERGGLHCHIIVNAFTDCDRILTKNWPGHVWYERLQTEETFEKLAAYMAKEPKEEGKKAEEQIKENTGRLHHYGCSRNLERPEPEIKEYRRRTMRDKLEKISGGDYMNAATPGYTIDKNTVTFGINPFTGMTYLHYTETKNPEEKRTKGGGSAARIRRASA